MVENDDTTLVRQCLEGNSKAFEKLLLRHQKTIFNLVYRMCNDYDDAQDITQSVFIKAYENLKSYKSRYKFYSWIYRIAINEGINYLVKNKHSTGLKDTFESLEGDPDKTYDQMETSAQVQKALIELNNDYRTLIVLKHFQECSYQDMSQILGIAEKTVKSRLYMARQQLGKILKKQGLKTDD
jgi:RNA polymerase sigma-70 factor (ECF subfamily)